MQRQENRSGINRRFTLFALSSASTGSRAIDLSHWPTIIDTAPARDERSSQRAKKGRRESEAGRRPWIAARVTAHALRPSERPFELFVLPGREPARGAGRRGAPPGYGHDGAGGHERAARPHLVPGCGEGGGAAANRRGGDRPSCPRAEG